MLPYLITLLVMTAASALLREWRMALVLLVLGVNWLVNSAVVAALGISDPWWLFLPADYASALVLLIAIERPCRWTVAVAAFYAFQIGAHGAYGATPHDAWAKYYYYYTLSYLAWGQLGIVGGWISADILRRIDWGRLRGTPLLSGFQRNRREGGEE